MARETTSVLFDDGGPEHTEDTLRLALERVKERDLRSVVVASYSGITGVMTSEVFRGYNVAVVGGVYGFSKPNAVGMLEENRLTIERNGGRILFSGHAFGMLGRSVNRRFGAIQVDEVIAHVLRLFCAGVKVACEVSCMAVDSGLIRSGEEVMAIGGTGTGADTAVVLRAANTHTFFETRILEIVCKPRG